LRKFWAGALHIRFIAYLQRIVIAKKGALMLTIQSVPDAIALAAKGQITLLDVREMGEVAASGTAAGAVHIPLGLLPLKADPKAPDYDARLTGKPVAVFCAAGARAGRAVALLQQYGFEAVNIGGFGDWCGCGGPTQKHA
jgi:rhodanese-related sulfurtransferase